MSVQDLQGKISAPWTYFDPARLMDDRPFSQKQHRQAHRLAE